MRRRKRPDVLQGTLDLLVLKILSRGPHHGYGIAADIEAISEDILASRKGRCIPCCTLLACAAPAWRATRTDPLRALRG